jgi:hypothetical protein
MDSNSDLLTASTFAAIANEKPDRVRYLARTGRLIPACRTPTGIILFHRADAERMRDELQRRAKIREKIQTLQAELRAS